MDRSGSIERKRCVSFLVGQTSYVSITCDEPDEPFAPVVHAFTFPESERILWNHRATDNLAYPRSITATVKRNHYGQILIQERNRNRRENRGRWGSNERSSTLEEVAMGFVRRTHKTQYIHQVFKLVSVFDRQRVGGWVVG